jgi:hypothetical protein
MDRWMEGLRWPETNEHRNLDILNEESHAHLLMHTYSWMGRLRSLMETDEIKNWTAGAWTPLMKLRSTHTKQVSRE